MGVMTLQTCTFLRHFSTLDIAMKSCPHVSATSIFQLSILEIGGWHATNIFLAPGTKVIWDSTTHTNVTWWHFFWATITYLLHVVQTCFLSLFNREHLVLQLYIVGLVATQFSNGVVPSRMSCTQRTLGDRMTSKCWPKPLGASIFEISMFELGG